LGGRAFGQSPPQLTDFFKTLCHVTYDRDNRDYYGRTVPQRENREFNRDCRSVLVQRRYGENIALAITAISRLLSCDDILASAVPSNAPE
jgi:hypothetical protein